MVLLANAEDGTVSVLDATEHRVLRTLDVIPDGPTADLDPTHAAIGQPLIEAVGGANYAQDLDIAPDGRTLYVSRGHRGDIAAFDLSSGEMLWKTAVPGLRADHMTIARDGLLLYVSALTNNVVQIVDAETGDVLGSFPTGQWPHENHLSHDGRLLYNASIGDIISAVETRDMMVASGQSPYQITVVDLDSGEQLRTFDFDAGVRPFVLTHDDTMAYLQLSEWSGIAEFDMTEAVITRRLDLPIKDGVSEDDYEFEAPHHGIALTRDETKLCIAGRISDYAAIVDVESLSLLATIDTGDAPSWAANTPDDRHCVVANNRDATVSFIEYESLSEVARVAVGQGPKFLQPATIEREVVCPAAACD